MIHVYDCSAFQCSFYHLTWKCKTCLGSLLWQRKQDFSQSRGCWTQLKHQWATTDECQPVLLLSRVLAVTGSWTNVCHSFVGFLVWKWESFVIFISWICCTFLKFSCVLYKNTYIYMCPRNNDCNRWQSLRLVLFISVQLRQSSDTAKAKLFWP